MEFVNKQNIGNIIESGENQKVEIKSHVRIANQLIGKLISGFANTEGGIVIFGIDERSEAVTGVDRKEKAMLDKSIINGGYTEFCNSYFVDYLEKTLLVLQIEKADRLVLSGGIAYQRRQGGQHQIIPSDLIVSRVVSESNSSSGSSEIITQMFKKVYDELIAIKEDNVQGVKEGKRNNWIVSLVCAGVGAILGTVVTWLCSVI